MTTELILTEEQTLKVLSDVYGCSPTDVMLHDIIAAAAIQEAVLQSAEVQRLHNQDPLQGAANWIVEAIKNCDVTDIQYHLIIGYNRAKRLFDSAMEQKT